MNIITWIFIAFFVVAAGAIVWDCYLSPEAEVLRRLQSVTKKNKEKE